MRKYPGCSPIARPSRSNVFFSQSSMKVARHRLIFKPRQQPTIPAKHPRQGHPPHPKPSHCGKAKLTRDVSHTACPSHGPSLRQTGAWRLAARAFALPAAGPALSLSGGATATGTTGLTLGRPGMPTPRYVSRTADDLVLGIPEAQPSPKISCQVNVVTTVSHHSKPLGNLQLVPESSSLADRISQLPSSTSLHKALCAPRRYSCNVLCSMIGQERPDDVSRSKMKRSNVTARYRAWPVARVARVGSSSSRRARKRRTFISRRLSALI